MYENFFDRVYIIVIQFFEIYILSTKNINST
jgi:hypothetical protein